MNQERKVKVSYIGKDDRHGTFHGFFQVIENEACAYPGAVVEFEDGSVETFDASRITFISEGQGRGESAYADYQAQWEAKFGDEDVGEYAVLVYDQEMPMAICHLSEEEFAEHVVALNEQDILFKLAQARGDDDAMDKALRAAFPHEVVLLV